MITRDDVARHAGVSKSTVSRVLNKNGYVSQENRTKIEKAIVDLGYAPNLIARSLKTRESRQILFYTHEILNPFYMEVYRGIEDYAGENGYTIVLSRHFDYSIVKQRQYDGIILSGVSTEMEREFINLGIPVVVTHYGGKPLNLPSVGIDIKGGAQKATQYLLKCGHRKIAFITINEKCDEQRLDGFLNCLKNTDIDIKSTSIVCSKEKSHGYSQGYSCTMELLSKSRDFTAVFAFNDTMAIGALSAFYEKGIKVPQDISIIGFDDIIQASYTYPLLTTVKLPKYEQGYESARLLISLIQGNRAESMTLDTQLVIRNSVLNKISLSHSL